MNMIYESNNDPNRHVKAILLGLIATMMFLAVLAALSSCKQVEYVNVPGPTVHDTISTYRVRWDSVYVHDSVYFEKEVRNDTVFLTKNKVQTEWRDRIVLDSIYIHNNDTIPVPYEVEKKVVLVRNVRLLSM